MADSLIRAMVLGSEASVIACSTTDLVNVAIQKHDLSPTPSAALGRLLTAAAMMTKDLKNSDDSLTVSINGGGSVGNLVVSADARGNVRGYVDNPHAEAPLKANGKLNVSGIVGTNGKVTVIKSDGKNPSYVGVSELVGGEIAEDLAQYYHISEQKSTSISLGVLVDENGKCLSAGGLYLQLLPFASEETILKLEEISSKMTTISKILKEMTPKQLLEELFSGYINIVEESRPRFMCKCNRNNLKKIIAALPPDEIESIKKQYNKVEVTCHFCGKRYEF